MNNLYKVGLYIRLSKEDEKCGESESITNQKSLLLRFVMENCYAQYSFFVDDGYSGTNFDRPAFKQMISDIEAGRINMVVTKDLSRLGRDYIGCGEYLEKYFPEHNVRYIALTDNIDTTLDSCNNDIVPFKAIMNDYYAKDISKKIKTALIKKQKDGKWVGGCPPLGYMIAKDNKNKLVINPNEYWIIRKIFKLALKGNTTYQIKEYLNKEKIPTSSIIRGIRGNSKMASLGIWNTKTILNILTNRIYTGDLVQHKRQKLNYKVKKIVPVLKDNWIIVPDTHDAIIDKEDFIKVEELLNKNKRIKNKNVKRLLDGLLYCYECKHRLSICSPRKKDNKTYLVCNYYRMYSKNKVCTSHAFNYDILEREIIKLIKDKINKLDINKIKLEITKYLDTKDNTNIKKIEIEKNKKINYLDKMYLDKLDNKIDSDMYERISNNIKLEIKEIDEILELKIDNNQNIEDKINMYLDKIDRELIIRLIDRIEISKDKDIFIYYNFCNH